MFNFRKEVALSSQGNASTQDYLLVVFLKMWKNFQFLKNAAGIPAQLLDWVINSVNFLITKTEVYFSKFCSFPTPNESKKSLSWLFILRSIKI